MKVGIIGGGQLGRMLLQAAINYPVETYVLENDPECPAAHLCNYFVRGEINNYNAVYEFGKALDAVTIEIEAVNTDALEQLEKEGVRVIPNTNAINTLKDKILQKEFYNVNAIPTSPFVITNNIEHLSDYSAMLPAVHKLARGGYDGKGVRVINNQSEFKYAFDEPAVLEKKINIKKEISIIVAVDTRGETALYPCSEMLFDPSLNLLDFQLSPSQLPEKVLWKAEAMALNAVKHLDSAGVFAIEMFVDKNDDVWINEIAPRVHNSGHHTIEASYSSQFDMLWRIILNYPLGNTESLMSSAIVNIIGSEGYTGKPKYLGLEKVLKLDNIFLHLYGKKITKPGRKLGHVTILSNDRQELIHQANKIKNILRVISE